MFLPLPSLKDIQRSLANRAKKLADTSARVIFSTNMHKQHKIRIMGQIRKDCMAYGKFLRGKPVYSRPPGHETKENAGLANLQLSMVFKKDRDIPGVRLIAF